VRAGGAEPLRYTQILMLRRTALALFAIALLTACSEPPIKERHQAEGGIAAARAADAATYAPEPLQAAEAALIKYDEAVARRDYRQALNFAIEARDRAYEAAKQASNEKAVARSAAEKLVDDVEALVKTATSRLSPTGNPRLGAGAADRVRASLRAAPQALQEARTLIQRQDYRGAFLRLRPLAEDLRRELGPAELSPPKRGR
jgi:hypothetical protein